MYLILFSIERKINYYKRERKKKPSRLKLGGEFGRLHLLDTFSVLSGNIAIENIRLNQLILQ
jgi:hypothetical protein